MIDIKRIFSVVRVIFLPFLFLFLSCSKDTETKHTTNISLVYMVADNNLSPMAIEDINEMEMGWEDSDTEKLLVYVDASYSDKLPKNPVLIQIQRDTSGDIKSSIVYSYPERNSTDKEVLREVLEDVLGLYENAHIKGIVFWSHANAWLPQDVNIQTNGKAFGRDENPLLSGMSLWDMREALDGFHFNFIVFDACFMGSVEVLYQMKDIADVFVASPTEILAFGFPYQRIVPLFAKEHVDFKNIGQQYFYYYKEKSGKDNWCSISVVRSKYLSELSDLCKGQFCVDDTDSLQQYTRQGQGYFFDLKQILLKKTDIKSEVEQLWSKLIIYENHTEKMIDLGLENCNGLSVYIKNKNQVLNDYYKKTLWDIHGCGFSACN